MQLSGWESILVPIVLIVFAIGLLGVGLQVIALLLRLPKDESILGPNSIDQTSRH